MKKSKSVYFSFTLVCEWMKGGIQTKKIYFENEEQILRICQSTHNTNSFILNKILIEVTTKIL